MKRAAKMTVCSSARRVSGRGSVRSGAGRRSGTSAVGDSPAHSAGCVPHLAGI